MKVMKKSLLFLLALVISLGTMAQVKPVFNNQYKDIKVERQTYKHDGTVVGMSNPNVLVSSKATMEDPILMQTLYDLQSNCNAPRHIYVHPDATISVGATWSATTDYNDRGTGYNYFDGTAWDPMPTARIEPLKSGWPSIAPWGANGECVVTHRSGTTPLQFTCRSTKGTGTWTTTDIPNPTGYSAGMLWPRMITNGTDHMNVHVIALTAPTANGGAVYNGMDGALLYNRSLDGGTSWEGWQQLGGMTSSEYVNISADVYEWANPVGETIAFVYGDNFTDFAIQKSTDNGASWTQTIVWPCPYPLYPGSGVTDTFYCCDSYVTAAMDPTGTVHVMSGLQRSLGDATTTYWFPFTDGVLYWNETMPQLDEWMDPVQLEEDGNIIGWVPDTMIYYNQQEQLAHYYNSLSSFPTMSVDEQGNLYAIWSSVVNLLDPDNYMLRHIMRRSYSATAAAWQEEITDVTGDFLYTWSECVYPSASPTTTTDKVHIVFMADDLGGVKLKGDNGAQGQTITTTNNITYITTPTYVGVEEPAAKNSFYVEQNSPNPVESSTSVKVILSKPGNLSLVVSSMVGQQVMEISEGNVAAGPRVLSFDCSSLPAGVYFYTVNVGKESITKKMVVK